MSSAVHDPASLPDLLAPRPWGRKEDAAGLKARMRRKEARTRGASQEPVGEADDWDRNMGH